MKEKSNIQKLTNFLKKLGLTKNQRKIYIALNKYGNMNIADISRNSGVPRTSVVRNLKRLEQKGLVSKTMISSNKLYIAEPPNRLEIIIRNEEIKLKSRLKEIDEVQKEMDEAIKIFNNQRNVTSNEQIEVKYFQGLKGFKDVHDRTLDLADKEVLFFSNHDKWRKAYDLEYDNKYYVPKRIAKGIQNRSLVLKNEFGKELNENSPGRLREVRYLGDEFNFDTTFIIYKNNVSIMISDKPYTAINIKSKDVYKTFKNIFEYLWNKTA